MSNRTMAGVLAVATVGMTFGIAGCGVSTESAPSTLDPADVPFGLLDDEPANAPQPAGAMSFALYFIDTNGQLVRTERSRAAVRGPNASLRQLLAGPTEQEAASGLTTAIPPGTTARTTVISGDLVVIELSGSLVEMSRADASAAIAQLVFTATEPDGVGRVLFRVNGEPVEIPRGDGTLTAEAVGRGDYAVAAT